LGQRLTLRTVPVAARPTPATPAHVPSEEGAGPIPPFAADEPRRRDAADAELMATLAAETEED
jgi:hypothetical protein